MSLLILLIVIPVICAALLLFFRQDSVRDVIVIGGAIVIALLSIATVILYRGTGAVYFAASSVAIDYLCAVIGILVALIILWQAKKYKNVLAFVLGLIQLIGAIVFDFFIEHSVEVTQGIYIDSLSVLMAFIIGVIGSGICVYALGYMKDFQHHVPHWESDRRPIFFALMFIFLAAMYLIVFANNMSWMFTGWEVTTLCSFLLIGYTKTEEAIRNAFRQIIMNVLGGLGFLLALYISAIGIGTLSFVDFIAYGVAHPAFVALPVTALAFAGLTKAAQMPFHTWLLGAMVAPTPTSALLHSSTMVKAGVFLLVKLSPVLMVCPIPSTFVMLIGGITFLLCSFMAISQTNAKRVLAYSTIANLGLITACAGVGTPEAVWAAAFLILFHAAAKSLLFLCVGTAEHHIGSRNIEDMDLLFERMPKLARLMILGIMCMFIAPLGMLIAKWATLASFVDQQQFILILLLAFGSAATFMFWAKWMGKLSGIAGQPENIEHTVHKSEWASLYLMAALIVITCVFLPAISQIIVMPYITDAFSIFGAMAASLLLPCKQFIGSGEILLCAILCVFIFIILLTGLHSSKAKRVDVYLSGASVDNASRTFKNSFSEPMVASARGMYLNNIFGEKKLTPFATILTTAIIVIAFIASLVVVVL